MKLTIWDILTGVTLLGILCMVGVFGFFLMNPGATPLPQAVDPTATMLVLPTNTITSTPPRYTRTPELPTATPTRRPTWTLIPTQTPVVLPSFTKAPKNTGDTSGGSGACNITTQDPVDGAYVLPDKDFKVHWVIQNTSNKSWDASNIDLRFVNGDRVHKGADAIDLPYTVSALGNLDLTITMHAPATKGDYASYWSLNEGSVSLCRFFIKFRVP